jgi:hypothetical protein
LKAHNENLENADTIKKQVSEDEFKRIQTSLRDDFNNEKLKIAQSMKDSGAISVKLETINKRINNYYQSYWDINKDVIQSHVTNLIHDKNLALLIAAMADTDPNKSEAATKQFLSIAAVVYKSYMDELFYSNRYREPKNAALFNAYLASYLRVTGSMSSIGCKSANDRTYIIRLFLAAINNKDKRIQPLPEPLHRDLKAYEGLCDQVSKIKNSNTALYSCIVDTAGGTPKIDAKKFKYLYLVEGIKYIGQLGQYAAHKMYEALTSVTKKIKDTVADNKFVTAYKTHKKAMRFLSQHHDPLQAANDEFIQTAEHGIGKENKKKKIGYADATKYNFKE